MPVSWEQSVLAACLAAEGVASRRRAAALWDLRGCQRGPIEIIVAGRRRPELDGVVAHTTGRLGGSGRNGSGALRRLLEARDPATPPTESMLEDLLVRVLRGGGLPEPVRQFRVGDVRVDLAYPGIRLAIEADSRVWHSGRADVQRNSSKRNLLVGSGWRVLHFTWFDATTQPASVVATVAAQMADAA